MNKPFELNRPNASIWDLTNDEQAEFRAVTDLYDMTGKHRSPMANATLIQIYKYFGSEKVCAMIERWAMLGFHSLDSLVKLCKGEIPTERTVSKNSGANEMPGKGRVAGGEPKSVQSFLGEMKGQLPATQQERQPSSVTSSLRKNLFSQSLAIQWLLDRGLTVEVLEDYFLQAGIDQNQNKVYQLRKEYD